MEPGSRIEFSVLTPGDDATIGRQIDHALSLGLPEIDQSGKSLHLIANGPSARNYNVQMMVADTMALNGALRLFTDKGCHPTYWAACDPQGLVAEFLTDAPEQTEYLVASKCHPAVFERLRDRNAKLWHLSDYPVPPTKRQVPCSVSVTLCALMLAHRLGYRRIDVWGWDCCLGLDGSHHAAQGELSATPDEIEIEIAETGQRFRSNPTWAAEMQDAAGILPVLKWCGTEVVIHGRSMIGAYMSEFSDMVTQPQRKVA